MIKKKVTKGLIKILSRFLEHLSKCRKGAKIRNGRNGKEEGRAKSSRVKSNNSASRQVASIAFITWSGIEETELGIRTSCCSPSLFQVRQSSRDKPLLVGTIYPNALFSLSLSFSRARKSRGRGSRSSKRRNPENSGCLKLWIRFRAPPGFLYSISSQVATLKEITLRSYCHSVEKFLSILFVQKYYTLTYPSS